MLSVEEFSCQFSMERTCGQYCSSQSMARTTAWGWPNYLRLDWILRNLHGGVVESCRTRQS